MLECAIEKDNNVMTVNLLGEIDHHGANLVRAQIDSQILSYNPQLVVMDLSSIGFMDSSGIGLILGRYRLIQTLGATLAIHGVDDRTTRLLKLTGISSILELKGGQKV